MATGHHIECECRACRTVQRQRGKGIRPEVARLCRDADEALMVSDLPTASALIAEALRLNEMDAEGVLDSELADLSARLESLKYHAEQRQGRMSHRARMTGGVL